MKKLWYVFEKFKKFREEFNENQRKQRGKFAEIEKKTFWTQIAGTFVETFKKIFDKFGVKFVKIYIALISRKLKSRS